MVRERLNDYVDRQLSGQERAAVAAHLADCSDCAADATALEHTVHLLRRLPEPDLPPALAETVMERIRAGEAEPGGWLRGLRQLLQPTFTVSASAALAAVAVFVVMRPPGETPLDAGVAVAPPTAPAHLARVTPQPGTLPAESRPYDPSGPRAALSSRQASAEDLGGSAPRRNLAGQIAEQMRGHTRAVELARRGQSDAIAQMLRGAGHPHSVSLASHFDSGSGFDLIQPAIAR